MRYLTIILLSLAAFAPSQAQDVLGGLRDQGLGFAQVTPGYSMEFPRDHGAHPDYRIEWWYLTANLTDADGPSMGFCNGRCFARRSVRIRSRRDGTATRCGWRTPRSPLPRAISTSSASHAVESARPVSDRSRLKVVVSLISTPGSMTGSGARKAPTCSRLRFRFNIGDRDIVLLVESTGELVQNGDKGYSQKSAQGQASYYYSQPHLRVRGFVNQGIHKTYLNGKGWLDREWSSQALAANQQGWDWFSLHLDDGHKLMVYQLRHDDGEHWLSGNWINPRGDAETLERSAIDLRATRNGSIAVTAGQTRELPMEWQLALVDHNRSWRIRPLYDEQWMATSIPYWEGVVLVEDAEGIRSGVGYMELTGYQ